MTDQSVIMPQDIAEDKKIRILDSARKLLIQRGFQDIAMDDVAREAGVAKGTLFLYYESKDELFTAVYADMVDRLGRTFDDLLSTDSKGPALLEKLVRVVLSCFEDNRDFLSQFGVGKFPACGARSAERLMDKFRENHKRVASLLERALGPADRKTSAFRTSALFGLCRSAMMEKLINKSEGSLIEQTAKVVHFYLYGVGK